MHAFNYLPPKITMQTTTLNEVMASDIPVKLLLVAESGRDALLAQPAAARWVEAIDLAGLFYLTGSAPTEARRAFLGLWFAQIAIAAAAIPLTDPPFAVMAPVWGIGLITWWASAHATFPPRKAGSDH